MRSFATGPIIIHGNINPAQNVEPDQGPSIEFQGSALFDSRFAGLVGVAPMTPDQYLVRSLYNTPYFPLVDAVPQALSTTRIAGNQATVAATPMTLASAQAAGLSINIPLVPFVAGQQKSIVAANVVTPTICLDFGFTTFTGTSGNSTGTIPANAAKFFYKGQKIIIAHGRSATLPLFTTVTVTPTSTTLTFADALGANVTNTQIGTADPTGISAWPWQVAGAAAMFDPYQALARAVSITGNAGSTAQNFTVVGYDFWGNPQTEVIAFAGGAATTAGKKAFKWITSVTPAATDGGHNLSVGTTDVFGLTLRSDFWEYMNIFYNGAFITSSTGWLAAVNTDPATSSTGDSKGTYAVQSASDGAKRLACFMSLPVFNAVNANNLSFASIFGVTPA